MFSESAHDERLIAESPNYMTSYTTNQLIGQQMRARREYLGRSQSDVGDVLGISKDAVSKIERGVNAITAADLLTVGGYLGVPVAYFVGDVDETPAGQELLLYFESMTSEQKEMFVTMARAIVEKNRK